MADSFFDWKDETQDLINDSIEDKITEEDAETVSENTIKGFLSSLLSEFSISLNFQNNTYSNAISSFANYLTSIFETKSNKTANLNDDYTSDNNTYPTAGSVQSWSFANFISKSNNSTGLLKPNGSIDNATYLTSSALNNYIQIRNVNGLLKANGEVDYNNYLTEHQSLDNYIMKSSTNGVVKNDGSIGTDYVTMEDLTDYIQTSETTGLVKNDGTIDENSYATTSNISSVNASISDLESVVNNKSDLGHTHSFNSLTGKPNIPDVSEFIPLEEFDIADIFSYYSEDLEAFIQNPTLQNFLDGINAGHDTEYTSYYDVIPMFLREIPASQNGITLYFVTINNTETGNLLLSGFNFINDIDFYLFNIDTSDYYHLNGVVNSSSGGGVTSYNDLTDKPTIPDVSGKEDISNKVTSISSSSTDTQYPSAKLLYDTVNDGSHKIFYGTCSTSADTQIKIIENSNFEFINGNILIVHFSQGQSFVPSSGSYVQFKIDNTYKKVFNYGSSGSYANKDTWTANSVVMFVLEDNGFVKIGNHATTSGYGLTVLNSSVSSTSESYAATPKAVKTAYDLANGKADANHTHTISNITDISDITSRISALEDELDGLEEDLGV